MRAKITLGDVILSLLILFKIVILGEAELWKIDPSALDPALSRAPDPIIQ
jgi:hypothetical protein